MSSVEDLRRRVHDLQSVLASASLMPIVDEERRDLRRRLQDVQQKLESVEDQFLLMGLVGGTGVGKSTLMNALAQKPIASVSHRRPHTDRVLVYRHADCLLPRSLKLIDELVHEIVHQADAARQVIMADLPDFDSLVQEHRQRVVAFMEHMDLVLWVTTPEKYADGRFYEMLREAPKSRQNFAFVLNKADLLFSGSSRSIDSEDFHKVVHSMGRLLEENGVDDPVLYVISAQEVLDGAPLSVWNQFPFLRRWVFQKRDAKEIRAIKEANLDVEFQAVFLRIREGMEQLERAVRFLNLLEADLLHQDRLGQTVSWGRTVLGEVSVLESLTHSLQKVSDLQGPAALFGWMVRLISRVSDASQSMTTLSRHVATALHERFQKQMTSFKDHSVALAYQEGLVDPLRTELLERLHGSWPQISLAEAVREAIEIAVVQAQRRTKGFMQWRQRLWSSWITALLLLALGGQDAWRAALAHPGAAQIVALVAAMVEKLFSGQGLAALGTWTFLQFLVGARFYREYKKSLQRHSETIIDSLQSALEQVLREALEAHAAVVRRCREDLEEEMAVMARLGGDEASAEMPVTPGAFADR
ncbi:GTPase [Desulfosoma caldarium]|uniref:50S ribosome-binding GTPase n=1 Tax=Desulfosoma caldarium TaxID=610254 RepID=A0A3N1VQG2_9BACT|nr:GTPase [Desulfosoma caldarium]ROR03308.1 50S ribosome-binding GTPase [Desulfosoma caldarium]